MTQLARPSLRATDESSTKAQSAHQIDWQTCVWVTADKFAHGIGDWQFPTVSRLVTLPMMFVAHSEEEIRPLLNGHILQVSHRTSKKATFFEQRVAEHRRSSASDLLRSIVTTHGISWVELARTLDVSVPAIRKWRTTGRPSSENQLALAGIHALLDALLDLGVADPARWLIEPLVDGYTVNARDLYEVAGANDIINLAAHPAHAPAVLSDFLPEWRESYSTRFVIKRDRNDEPSIGFRD